VHANYDAELAKLKSDEVEVERTYTEYDREKYAGYLYFRKVQESIEREQESKASSLGKEAPSTKGGTKAEGTEANA